MRKKKCIFLSILSPKDKKRTGTSLIYFSFSVKTVYAPNMYPPGTYINEVKLHMEGKR